MKTLPQRGSADYSRLSSTPFRQEAVGRLRTIIVGAGALGNEVIKALGLMGAGEVVVIDPDRVEPSNLSRSLFFRLPLATGRNKAVALADAASRIFPDTLIRGIPKEVAEVGFQQMAAADLIFSCVDSEMTRLEIAYLTTKLDQFVVDAGLGSQNYSHGRVSVFAGRRGACFSCQLSQRRRRELMSRWESPVRSCWTHSDSRTGSTPPGLPSTPTMAAVTGALQVELGLRRFFELQGEPRKESTTLEISLDGSPKFSAFRIPKSVTCPFHSIQGNLLALPELTSKSTVRDLLEEVARRQGSPSALLLDWPLCTRAICLDCSSKWSPMQRLAAFRRQSRCPRCRSRNLQEDATIRSIDGETPWADWTLSELGLPLDHLFTFRSYGGQTERSEAAP